MSLDDVILQLGSLFHLVLKFEVLFLILIKNFNTTWYNVFIVPEASLQNKIYSKKSSFYLKPAPYSFLIPTYHLKRNTGTVFNCKQIHSHILIPFLNKDNILYIFSTPCSLKINNIFWWSLHSCIYFIPFYNCILVYPTSHILINIYVASSFLLL